MRVYLSGPITGVPDYKDRFQTAADLILAEGNTVVNPANMDMVIDGELTHKQIMEMDIRLMECCDAVYMLPGWENSKGAKREHAEAMIRRMKVRYLEDREEGKRE